MIDETPTPRIESVDLHWRRMAKEAADLLLRAALIFRKRLEVLSARSDRRCEELASMLYAIAIADEEPDGDTLKRLIDDGAGYVGKVSQWL